jgi:2-amino-4-hydroxy-6-hydroxymethyldihydropteridine diphosphokinase
MTIVYLALGSNVGNSNKYIDDSITLLKDNLVDLVEAPRYKTKAVGYTNQDDFINTAIMAHTDLNPHELLVFIKNIEKKLGRIERFRWGPREIDIDIIFYNNSIIKDSNLSIPHPRFAQRDFVLRPLLDLSPNFVDPKSRKTIKQLFSGLPTAKTSIKSNTNKSKP